MADASLQTDEFVLGTLGLVFSVGFLKANEVFEFFDHTDVFRLENHNLVIHGREFLALFAFSASYVVFLAVALIGVMMIARRQIVSGRAKDAREQTLLILSATLLVLFVSHFFSFALAYSHTMHKYNEMIRIATDRTWDFSA